MDSILTSVKKMLGISDTYEHFDTDIIMHINSVFSILTQLGVGSTSGFSIDDELNTWSEFITNIDQVEMVKSYMYLKVKMMFDPPQSSALIEVNKELIKELEWRINTLAETSTIT